MLMTLRLVPWKHLKCLKKQKKTQGVWKLTFDGFSHDTNNNYKYTFTYYRYIHTKSHHSHPISIALSFTSV